MNMEPTAKSSSPLTEELDVTNTIRTLSFFDDSIFNAALNPLKVHLEKDSVDQNVLDRCLLSGFQIIQTKDREMSQVAPTLQLLLQHGARWKDGVLLGHDMTSYHLICQSTGDNHELLDWMLKSSDQTLINTQDSDGATALFYAVQKENINCVRTLIVNGADVTTGVPRWYAVHNWNTLSPVIAIIIKQFSTIKKDIFDLLLDNAVDITKSIKRGEQYTLIDFAFDVGNVECVIKFFQKGAKLNVLNGRYRYVWERAAKLGSVELRKCILNQGIDKDSIDLNDPSLLLDVVSYPASDVEAVRYLLDLGVTVPSYVPKVKFDPCTKCGINKLLLDDGSGGEKEDPCMVAITNDDTEIVQMLVEHGSQSCQSLIALVHAVRSGSFNVIEYLLNKCSYPLNITYYTYSVSVHRWGSHHTLLTESFHRNAIKITKLLLDHGADPNIKICMEKESSILLAAIQHKHEEVIALYIRSGVDINYRSFDWKFGMVLPFEASVLHDRLHVTELLLVSGCSCGMFSLDNNQEMKDDIKPDLKDLMKIWNVDENNVKPLMQQCRRMILNHMSPQADKKITKMSLPSIIVNYLRIPELDDILTACRNSTGHRNRYASQCEDK